MLYYVSVVVLTLIMLISFFAAIEIGFRLGRRRSAGADDDFKSHIGSLQAALLGLLALLIGFVFAMAVSRYDTRKELLLDETNAITSTYLRARLLEEKYEQELIGLLRAYVDARLAFHDAGIEPARLNAAIDETLNVQEQLWRVATVVAEKDSHSVAAGMFVQSLNEMIDTHEKRIRALDNHVPDPVLYLVFLVALLSFGFIGYGCGLVKQRHFITTALVSVLVAFSLSVILDLDRPRRGLLKINQDSLIKLKQTLEQNRL